MGRGISCEDEKEQDLRKNKRIQGDKEKRILKKTTQDSNLRNWEGFWYIFDN